ncbi:LysR family transcriptional regulator [Lacisediminimonas sp.]|uniref:LysR family transcriptional regulator n=1 Tax=Lacisediminimonas sp. TaxID=3060582 RepID=UPI002722572E|nr:LysR family transcriptional regulator [Lacisediminimonas sp.]MDO8298843.1 LysR family transcriptional regulator [Lacisediminimonas sp.]MDO9217696.1 LysR family transcriptional regulator [Lacisediminimonas sp.]
MNLDLHLLQVFLAIHERRNVGEAAAALGMSQPGLSTALARLRRTLNDPLFVKTARGMEPTSRARALVAPIRAIVHSINSDLLVAPDFVPASSTREFKIALSDIGEGIYLPFAVRNIQETAPGVSLKSVFMPPRQLEEEMAAGRVDLAIGYFPDIKGGQFFQRRIGLHSFACLVRRDHPEVTEQLTMKQFGELGHVVVEAPARSQEVFEIFLKQNQVQRHVVLRTPHFMSVPVIVAGSSAISVVPQALADFFVFQPDIRQVRLPFVPPTFQVNLYWHRSVQLDPANQWLREIIMSCFDVIRQRGYDRNGKRRKPAAARSAKA